jgi:hypothetical protein
MDDGDRKLFTESLRHATEQHTGAALDTALDELGWLDAVAADRRDAVSLLFECQGAGNVTSLALDHLMAAELGTDHAALVLPRIGRTDPPGEIVGKRLLVHGIATRSLLQHESAAIAHDDGQAITVSCATLDVRSVTGLDPALELVEVRADLPVGDVSRVQVAWTRAVAAGQVALAHELIGVSRAMLRLARDHALERVQFGRPISGFQAIRHRLAESLVAIEAAQASADAAWDVASPLAASLAKAIAGSNARTVARHAQQVLGGMGYTTEHPLHRYVRRTLVLDQLLGSSRSLTREIGEQLLRTRQVPQMLPL